MIHKPTLKLKEEEHTTMKGNRTMKQYSIPGRVSGPALMLVLPLALITLVALGLTIQAGSGPFDNGGPFDASSVVPTADEVNVDQQVGFALYVVNSSPVTATDVLVWNPLPPDTTYVSASGGAFPVVGGTVGDGIPNVPLENQAYDARRHAAVPLTDAGSVTGVAWVGDVPPGEIVALGLIAAVDDPARRFLVDEMFLYDDRELVGQFSGRTWVPPHQLFLMFILSRFEAPMPTPTPAPTTTMTFPLPYGRGLGFGGGSLHSDYGQALAGVDLRFGDDDVYLGQAPPSGPYLPWYVLGRAYGGWDTAALPDRAAILSATLVLDVGCNPPTTTFRTMVYQSLWTPPLAEDAWYAMGHEAVGAWDTADYPCDGCPAPHSCLVRIEIEPNAVNRTGLTLLEMRSDREGAPPTAPEQVLLNRSADFPALVITYVEEP
jgi:uncharacterized repeat protein (TIGR01451 family)